MKENVDKQILTQEENLSQATRTLDIATLESLYADDILMTGVNGQICSKTLMMEEAKRGIAERESASASGKKLVTSYDKEDLKIVSYGDVVISTYRFLVNIKGEDIDVNRRYRTTNVWMKRQDRWQVIAAHTSSLESA